MQLKMLNVENEMDIRVESLILEIQNYRDVYKLQLEKYKENFEK
jgi:hypothetical protein